MFKPATVVLLAVILFSTVSSVAEAGRKKSRQRSKSKLLRGGAWVWPDKRLRKLKNKICTLKDHLSESSTNQDKDPLSEMRNCTRLFEVPDYCSDLPCQYTLDRLRTFKAPLRILRKALRQKRQKLVKKKLRQTERALTKLLKGAGKQCTVQMDNETVKNMRRQRKACYESIKSISSTKARDQLLSAIIARLDSWLRPRPVRQTNKWEAFEALLIRNVRRKVKTMLDKVKDWEHSSVNIEECQPLFDPGFICECSDYFQCTRLFVGRIRALMKPVPDFYQNDTLLEPTKRAVEDLAGNVIQTCERQKTRKARDATPDVRVLWETESCRPHVAEDLERCRNATRAGQNSDAKDEIANRFLDEVRKFVGRFHCTKKSSRGKKATIQRKLKRMCREIKDTQGKVSRPTERA